MSSFYPTNKAGLLLFFCFRWELVILTTFVGTSIGVVPLLLAGVANRSNCIRISAVLIVDIILLLIFVGTGRCEMPYLAADKTGVLLILNPLWLVYLLALIRTVCKTVSWLLAAVTEENSGWLIAWPEGL